MLNALFCISSSLITRVAVIPNLLSYIKYIPKRVSKGEMTNASRRRITKCY